MKRVDQVIKRSRVLALTAFLALGLSAAPVLPAQAEDGAGSTVSGTVRIARSMTGVPVPLSGAQVCEGGLGANCTLTAADGTYTLADVHGWTMGTDQVFSPMVFPANDAQAALFMPTSGVGYVDLVPGGTFTGVDVKVRASSANGDVVIGDTVKATPPLKAARAKIAGKARVGKVLRLKSGHWAPVAVQLRYQWYRNGHRIAGATKKTYRLTAKDRRKRIQVRVTGKLGDQRLTVRSAATKRVR